jgi:hypothetical protein
MAARLANWRLEMGMTGFSVIGASFPEGFSRSPSAGLADEATESAVERQLA